jgi:hypothetical protein
MKHIVLLGDSIFDNQPYVKIGSAVIDIASKELEHKVTLLAVDGNVCADVEEQLKKLPEDTTDIFLSCGGNDALGALPMMDIPTKNINESLVKLYDMKENFRVAYKLMLEQVIATKLNVAVCTIYNKVPGIPTGPLTALALFNEIILEEAFRFKLPVIELRNIFTEDYDYSLVSPIEPSINGGHKLVEQMIKLTNDELPSDNYSNVYI